MQTISLPQLNPSHPMLTFKVRDIRFRIKLTTSQTDFSQILLFDDSGHERYRIDSSHRYWKAALIIVGKLMVDNPDMFGGYDG